MGPNGWVCGCVRACTQARVLGTAKVSWAKRTSVDECHSIFPIHVRDNHVLAHIWSPICSGVVREWLGS